MQTKASSKRASEVKALIAEQQFIARRRWNFRELARRLDCSHTHVRDVAMGYAEDERVMDVLIEERRKRVSVTGDYEFWRAA